MENLLVESLKAARKTIPACNSPIWASTGHLQTILGHLIPSKIVIEAGEHLNITLEKETERIHSTSMGHHVFINNHRGCGKGVGLATEPYHSDRMEDLRDFDKINIPTVISTAEDDPYACAGLWSGDLFTLYSPSY